MAKRKVLGVTIDEDLSFVQHANLTVRNCWFAAVSRTQYSYIIIAFQNSHFDQALVCCSCLVVQKDGYF